MWFKLITTIVFLLLFNYLEECYSYSSINYKASPLFALKYTKITFIWLLKYDFGDYLLEISGTHNSYYYCY